MVQRVEHAALDNIDRKLSSGRLPSDSHLQRAVAAVEHKVILATLIRCSGNQSQAARILGISRGTLRARMRQFGIPGPKSGGRPRAS